MDAVGDGDGCGRRCRGGGARFGGEVIRVWNFPKKTFQKKFRKEILEKKFLQEKNFEIKKFRQKIFGNKKI